LICVAIKPNGERCRAHAIAGAEVCIAHVGRVRNRPTMTEELVVRVVQAVAAGSYLNVAIAAAGVPQSTFYDWWRRGDPERDDPAEIAFRGMRMRVERARAEGETRNVAIIAGAAQGDRAREIPPNWQAAAWMLERSYPDRWARPSQRDQAIAPTVDPTPEEDPFADVVQLADRRQSR
jgi:hypothetical protein